MNERITCLGRSYIVSALLPSLVFVILLILTFPDFFRQVNVQLQKATIPGGCWLVLAVLTVWLALVLYNSEGLIIKFYEGYFFPQWRVLTWGQRRWHHKHTKHAKELLEWLNQPDCPQRVHKLKELRPLALAEMQLLELRAPWNEAHLLPTALGNVLRASEIYSYERYGIDGLTLWPRLFEVFPEKFVADLEDQNDRLAFSLNSSFLILLLGIVSLCTTLVSQLSGGFLAASAIHHLGIGIGLLVACYILYRIGTYAAEDYGLSIRAGFDLYRFDLLAKLEQPLPSTLREERDTWELLSEFFVAGDKFGELNFTYVFKDELGASRAFSEAQRVSGESESGAFRKSGKRNKN